MANVEYALGIDLGTTYSCVSVFRNGRPDTINNNDDATPTTPSWVSFQGGIAVTGLHAKELGPRNQKNTIFNAKRIIGRRFQEHEVQENKRRMPFDIVDVAGFPWYQVRDKNGTSTKLYAPEEISAEILKTLKKSAECFLGIQVTKAVITVPASFTIAQREATQTAGKMAGLEVLALLNEPTAAAIAYGFENTNEKCKILVFDFGGGTLDVSILEMAKNYQLTALATAGDMHFGGEDLDELLLNHCLKIFHDEHKIDLRDCVGSTAVEELRQLAAKAKERLSSSEETYLNLRRLHGTIDFSATITRKQFVLLIAPLLANKLMKPVSDALALAKLTAEQITEVVLVGGSSRIPIVQEILQSFFPDKSLRRNIDPDKAISHGAALQANALLTKGSRHTSGQVELHEINALSLGVEVRDGSVTRVVPLNTRIPTQAVQEFCTSEDNQTEVTFAVYEGERQMTVDNHLLGTFYLRGLPPLPKGKLKFDVTFRIDLSGLLHVTAKDRLSGKSAEIWIRERDEMVHHWM